MNKQTALKINRIAQYVCTFNAFWCAGLAIWMLSLNATGLALFDGTSAVIAATLALVLKHQRKQVQKPLD